MGRQSKIGLGSAILKVTSKTLTLASCRKSSPLWFTSFKSRSWSFTSSTKCYKAGKKIQLSCVASVKLVFAGAGEWKPLEKLRI